MEAYMIMGALESAYIVLYMIMESFLFHEDNDEGWKISKSFP